jgi:hypothetical protein
MGTAPAVIRAQHRTYHQSSWPAFAGAYAIASCTVAAAIAYVAPETFDRMTAVWLLFWATTTTVALACAAQWYVHRRFAAFDFVRHNEVGGFIIAVVGAVYGVLLGFMTVVAWQHFAESRQDVAQESAAATDAWHIAVGLPSAERVRVRRDMLEYARAMQEREWPAMRFRTFDKSAGWIVMDAIGSAGGFSPRNFKESNAQSATLQQLGALHDYRQRRLSDNSSGISSFEWIVLLVGAGCIVAFCWLFGLENANVHLLMTSAVAITVTSILVLLFELQYPFRSDLRITPNDWNNVITHINVMENGPQPGMRM